MHLLAHRAPASRFIYPLPLLTPGYADSSLVAGYLRDVQRAAPPLIIDATPHAPPGDDLTPPLGTWNPGWRYPATGREWWTMTPALRGFYDWVHRTYVVADSVGPDRWAVYLRRPPT